MSKKNAIVVVTFNRKKLLLECLDAIKRQTLVPDALFIVDNASVDGTPELLLKEKFINILPKKNSLEDQILQKQISSLHTRSKIIEVIYVRKKNNDGGAGGFHTGLKKAFENGYEWIWMMDDDVEPFDFALETLNKWKEKAKIIQPSRENYDGSLFPWGGDLNLQNGGEYHTSHHQQSLQEKGYSKVTVGCFEGMFINSKIIEKVGFPDNRFFIGGDDTIYGFLCSRHSEILLISDRLLRKKIPNKLKKFSLFGRKFELFSSFSMYYMIRNEFLKREILNQHNVPLNKKRHFLKVLRSVVIHSATSMILLDFERLKSVNIGLMHGLIGHFGKR